MTDKNLKIIIVVFGLSFLYSTAMWNKKDFEVKRQKEQILVLKNKIDSLQKFSDSLHMELYPAQIELSRFQIAYNIFLERNPKAASQYGDIISEETE